MSLKDKIRRINNHFYLLLTCVIDSAPKKDLDKAVHFCINNGLNYPFGAAPDSYARILMDSFDRIE